MSLQARLRHALGERWIDLPERGVDQPLVVGRAGNADVQVPSATVGARHCVLFVHDGHWVVQDVGGNAGTYVNGAKVDGATFLQVGDVVTLGAEPNAPAIDIDPAGPAQGRSGYATGAAPLPAATMAHDAPPYVPPMHPPYAGAPAYTPPPAAYPPNYPAYPPGCGAPPHAAPTAWAPHDPAAHVDPTAAALSAAAASSRFTAPRRPRPAGGGAGVVVGMSVVLIGLVAAGIWYYRMRQVPTQAARPLPATRNAIAAPAATRATENTSHLPQSIFDQAEARRRAATRPGATTRAAPRVTAPPAPDGSAMPPDPNDPYAAMEAETDPVDSTDPAVATTQTTPDTTAPAADDAAWKQVEAARFSRDEARAILLFDDYARTHPNTAADKLQAFTEAALDRIWLERLEQLAEQREDLNKKVQDVDRDMAQDADEAYKKRVLVPLKQQYASRLENIEEELAKNMKYDAKTVPNLLDETEVDKLRKSRDPQYYAGWKARVLAHIRRTHGELPWVTSKTS